MILDKCYTIIDDGNFVGIPAVVINCLKGADEFLIETEKDAIDFADLVGTAPPDEYPTPTVFIEDWETNLEHSLLNIFIHRLITKNNFRVIYRTNTLIDGEIPIEQNIVDAIKYIYDSLIKVFVSSEGDCCHFNDIYLEVAMESTISEEDYEKTINYYAPIGNCELLDLLKTYKIYFYTNRKDKKDEKFIIEFLDRWNKNGIDMRRKDLFSIGYYSDNEDFCMKNSIKSVVNLSTGTGWE